MAESTFRETADAVLGHAAHPTELVWRERTSGLTRFANNGVHQHAETEQRECIVRVCKDGRFGVVNSADCSPEGLGRAMDAAADAAPFGPAATGGLPAPQDGYPRHTNSLAATRDATPETRVQAVGRFTEAAQARGMTAAGAYSTETACVGVANSHGVRAWHESTDASFSATIMRPEGGSAWVERQSVDADALELDHAFEVVFEKAERAADVERLDPGKYTVLLEPAAVGELLQFLAWLGFGARQFLDGTSFMAHKLGEKITGDNITIVDDPLHPAAPGIPFDFEGTPHRPMPIVEAGVARNIAHNVTTAAEAGAATTGHALPQPNTFGPLPINLVVATGTVPRQDLMRQVDDGILVTRLWYNRVVDPGRTLVTGLTRDGTFRIRNGQLEQRVQDFRFNESVLGAFARVVAMSDTLERAERAFVPAMVIEDFTFSAVSGET